MSILDRIWWRINKKPPTRLGAYLTAMSGWILVGILLMLSLIATAIAWPLGLLLFILPIGYGLLEVRRDEESGTVETIYQAKLEQRESKMARLGIGGENVSGHGRKRSGEVRQAQEGSGGIDTVRQAGGRRGS